MITPAPTAVIVAFSAAAGFIIAGAVFMTFIERRELSKTNSAKPAQEIDMAEKLARTVGPTIGAEIHPDDATVGAMAMAHWSRHSDSYSDKGKGVVEIARDFIAEAKRQRLATEAKQ